MITPVMLLLFAVSLVLDVSGQMFFKHGMNKLPEADPGAFRLIQLALASPAILAGVVVLASEMVLWITILSKVPLSLAYPAASLNYCGILIASRFILKEKISRRRWAGGALVSIGVALVGATA